MISVVAYSGLQTTLTTRDQVQTQAARLTQMQRAFTIVQQDMTQAIDRSIRDRFGDPREPMLTELDVLEWTRGGHPNPLGQTRSSMQRVAYLMEDGELIRQQWMALDQPYEPNIRDTVLLDNVESLSFRFLTDDKEWLEDWPPADPEARRLPRAVEMELELGDIGTVTRMFLLPN
ncbi:type II secretion system minor pseudopilin GspJ [Alkalilimnicola ehrlichii]|uniref:type II secretion system minor pseudopilin GspJ n=1 Tax=Alkalilimnicola ehrlichii TaxID=351052 RepID=UPI0015F29D71|nr:type II secretion system minor pseudopilin GspJ [Alkalilimnicola ehrlichii]